MSDMNIDRLIIEVDASAERASKSLDKLASSIKNLAPALNRVKSFSNFVKELQELSYASGRIKVTTDNLNALTSVLTKLNGVKLKLTNVINGISRLGEVARSVPDMAGAASNINLFASAIAPLSTVPKINIGSLVNNLTKLGPAISALNSVDMGTFGSNISQFATAVSGLGTLKSGGFGTLIKGLEKIPELNASLDSSQIKTFAAHIREITAALQPLFTEVTKNEAGLVALNGIISANVKATGNMASANAAAQKSFTSIRSSITSVTSKIRTSYATIIATVFALKRIEGTLNEALKSSNEFIENLNLFTVTMGKGADEAYKYAEAVNELLGIDTSSWIRNQGVFMQIVSGFGVVSDKAQLMSKNLTQIGYDISSFYNIDIETAMQKVQSGIAGELEPLRRLGYALDAATLQQIAFEHGITQNINTMTQAQKSQLRYTAILEQSQNVMGDMARTIVTPANAMRILAQQTEQLKRSVGNIISVIAAKLIPYLQVFVRLLKEVADRIADFMGFELPKIDYSNLGDGLSSIADEADAATDALEALEEAKNFLAGFDEMERIPSVNDKASSAADTGTGFDLDIELPQYDFLADLEKSTDDLMVRVREKLSKFFEPLKVAWDAAKEWINGIDFQPFKDALQEVKDALEPFGKDIGDGIKWVWDNVLEPISKWTMEKAVPAVLSLLAAALRLLRSAAKKLKKPGKWLWEKFLQPLGKFTGDTIIKFLGDFKDLLNDITDVLDGNKSLGEFVADLNSLQIAIIGITAIFTGNALIGGIQKIIGFFGTLGAKIAAIPAGLLGALAALAAFLEGWNLGKAIYEKWGDEIDKFLEPIWDFEKGFGDFLVNFPEYWSEGWEEIKSFDILDWWTGIFEDLGEEVFDFFDDIGEDIKEWFEGWKTIPDDIFGWWDGLFDEWATNSAADAADAAFGIKEKFQDIGDWFGERWDDIKSAFRGVGSWFKEKFVAAKDRVHEAFDAIGTWFGNRWQDIKDVFSSVGTWFSEKFTDAEELIETAFSGLSEFFDGIWEGIKSGAVSAINGIIDFLNNWIDGAGGLINKIKTAFGGEEINFTHINHIQGYAMGGYPTSGQLFMARENNTPEMVGRIGSQTAVANNDQITTAIANAVRQAMIEAALVNGSNGAGTTEVRVYIDGKEVTDKVVDRINNTTKRNGKSPLLT